MSFLLGVFDLILLPGVWLLGSWPWRTSGFHCWEGESLACLPPPHVLSQRGDPFQACYIQDIHVWLVAEICLDWDWRTRNSGNTHIFQEKAHFNLDAGIGGRIFSPELNFVLWIYFAFFFYFIWITRSLWCLLISHPSCRLMEESWWLPRQLHFLMLKIFR